MVNSEVLKVFEKEAYEDLAIPKEVVSKEMEESCLAVSNQKDTFEYKLLEVTFNKMLNDYGVEREDLFQGKYSIL